MNRRELEQLVLDKLGTLDADAMRLVDALMLVLAEVWDDAADIGYNDVDATTPNPYREEQ